MLTRNPKRTRCAHETAVQAVMFIATTFVILFSSGISPAEESDPLVHQAERTLRCAELRDVDETALAIYRRARDEAQTVLSRNPDSAGANFVYFAAQGRILMADGIAKNFMTLRSLDKQYLDRALEIDPAYPNALAAKGGVLLDLPTLMGGDADEGLRLLKRANQINPSGVGTRVSLAKALARSGATEEALRQARTAAHHACMQRRRKALDDAVKIIEQLEPATARREQ